MPRNTPEHLSGADDRRARVRELSPRAREALRAALSAASDEMLYGEDEDVPFLDSEDDKLGPAERDAAWAALLAVAPGLMPERLLREDGAAPLVGARGVEAQRAEAPGAPVGAVRAEQCDRHGEAGRPASAGRSAEASRDAGASDRREAAGQALGDVHEPTPVPARRPNSEGGGGGPDASSRKGLTFPGPATDRVVVRRAEAIDFIARACERDLSGAFASPPAWALRLIARLRAVAEEVADAAIDIHEESGTEAESEASFTLAVSLIEGLL